MSDPLNDAILSASATGAPSGKRLIDRRPEIRKTLIDLLRRQIDLIKSGDLTKPITCAAMVGILGAQHEGFRVSSRTLREWLSEDPELTPIYRQLRSLA
jgi:hypothetical protein